MSDCLFCKIASGDIPAKIALDEDEVLVFHDVAPQAPTHLLVIPKRHVPSLAETGEGEAALLGRLLDAARRAAKDAGLTEYRVVNNCGASAGQSVFHVHLHVLGGRRFAWPPG